MIASAYGYRGDSETYDDLQNADLARVIERRKGLPVALSILYLHVARAQGWEAEGLAFPGHFLIRVEIDGARHVLDPFNDGLVRAAELRALLQRVLGPQAELSPEHFDPVPDRDVLLRLENNVRLRLAKREDWAGAVALARPHAGDRARPAGAVVRSRPDQCAARQAPRRDRRVRAVPGHRGGQGRSRASPARLVLLQELRRGLN